MASDGSLRRFGQVFDGVAAAYDDVRPSYPPELVAAACERGGLTDGSRVLELGCGTGKLTKLLVERGLVVDAVDPGPNMVEAARSRIGSSERVTFHISTFEDADLPRGAFAGCSRRRRSTGSIPPSAGGRRPRTSNRAGCSHS